MLEREGSGGGGSQPPPLPIKCLAVPMTPCLHKASCLYIPTGLSTKDET